METKKLGFGLMRLPVLDSNDAGTIDDSKGGNGRTKGY